MNPVSGVYRSVAAGVGLADKGFNIVTKRTRCEECGKYQRKTRGLSVCKRCGGHAQKK
eukprot:IDg22024t1